ncbi:MAG: DoxX family protein [Kineosporiaceae bacterium]|jgi:uncharacterized membrane protein
MNVVVWIVTVLLTLAFLGAGSMKITGKREQLLERMPWVADFTQTQVKGIGTVEVLGALGLVLPAITGIAPVLVPLAATGLTITMVIAAVVHLRRGDGAAAAIPSIVLGLLSAFVAWARFGPYPL